MPALKSLLSVSLCLFMMGCYYKPHFKKAEKETASNSKISREDKTNMPREREQWEYNRVKNPLTGEVPTENLLKVYNDYLKLNEDNATRVVIPNVEWKERGPNNIGGRTRAMIFDKNDNTYKTVFAAGIGGGLFKCTDIDATTPSWTVVNDFFSNIGISCLVQKQAHPDTIYFGTGEGYGNSDAQRGSGVWRSANGGSTFTQLGSSMGGSVPTYINRLAIATNGTIYAATSSGLYMSTNGGTSWSAFLTTGTSPASASNNGMDVKIAANGDIYYACIGQVWKYASSTWTNVTPSGTFFRIEIACAPSDAATVYLLCRTSGNPAFYYSSTSGSGWTSRSCPLIYDQAATATTEFTRGQSWYDLSIAVHPDTATTVYVGGIDYVKSKDAGATYRQISAWSMYAMPGAALLGTNQIIHADQHQLIFKPGTPSFALFGCDGGIYKSSNFNVASPTYTAINTDYNVTQYYSCAIANTAYSNNFIAGAQDNGTHKFTSAGVNSVTEVSGGDGAFCFIDQTNSNNQISSYVYNNYYKSTDATNFSTLSGSNSTGDFINPGDLDGVNGILYTKGGSDILSRWTSVFGSPTRTNITLTGVSGITHIKVSPNTPTTVYIGTSGGAIYKITGANTITSPHSPTLINTAFGGRISSLDIRKAATDDTILVTQSNYGLGNSVYITNNSTAGTPTWTDIDDASTLPDIPINWGLMSPTYSCKVVLATEMGIYTCNDIYASPPVWGQSVTGLANVRVDMLKMRMADSLVLAATHGRGLYTCDIFTTAKADFGADKTLVYVGESIQFTDDSYKATSYAWDFNDDGVTDATTQNPTYAFGTGGYKTIKLTINGTVIKTRTDYIQVLPNMSTPYDTAAGGNFDRYLKAFHFGGKAILGATNLWERGVPSNALTTVNSSPNAWKTDLDADIVNGTYQCALYTPNYNFTTSGTYTLSFRKSMEVVYCNAPVAVQVQYSTDKGVSWIRLGVNGSGTNWYNRGPATGCPVDAGIFSDQYGWTTTVSNESTSYDVSFLAGNANVAFRIVLSVQSGWGGGYDVDGFMVDDFTISGPSNSALAADIETVVSEQTQPLGASATVDYYSPNGKYLATLKNNTSHNFGNTKVEIDNAGIGTTNFSTNTTTTKRILQKTIKVTPANPNSSSVDITMYFSATEIDSFEATTGYSVSAMNLIKTAGNLLSSGTIANTVYGNSPVVASHLDGNKVTANFTTGFSGLGAGNDGANGPLPVTWLSFNGKRTVNEVALIWKTGSEINNSHFEIERMIEGETGFTNIGRQTGNGTINQISIYGFKDVLPAATNGKAVYYRLKQVDYNGKFEYSNIIILRYNNDSPIASIYPNPGNKILNIEVGSLEKENLSVQVFNQNGLKVFESKLNNAINSFNMEKYSSGLYLIAIYSNDEPILNEKWIKE